MPSATRASARTRARGRARGRRAAARAGATATSASEPPWKDAAPTLELDELQLNQLRALGYAVPG